MGETLTIKQANAVDAGEVVIALSDGRVLLVTLEQVLTMGRILPDEDE